MLEDVKLLAELTAKYEKGYSDGYIRGFEEGQWLANNDLIEYNRRLRDCLSAILGAGEAPAHAMDDGRAENRREERTAPSADGIRA